MPTLPLHGDHITLAQAVKAAGFADSGGHAKHLVRDGGVTVNGQPATQPGRKLVAGDRAAAVHATNQSITLAAAFGLLGTVAGLAGVEQVVSLLGLTGDAAEFGASYLRPIFALLAFQVIEQTGIACLVGAGDTRTGL